jgi:hypothetical protein
VENIMKKFITAKHFTFKLDNYEPYEKGRTVYCPIIYFKLPLQLSYMDLLQTIKIYTKYDGGYEWEFYPSYKEGKSLKELFKGRDFDELKIDEIFGVYYNADMTYGSMKFEIGARKLLKYSKVYPQIFQGHGTFPTEKEFMENTLLPDSEVLYKEEHYSEFNEEMKIYFKNKYKISDEIYESTWNSNKLIKN